jgi:hypothetical protein
MTSNHYEILGVWRDSSDDEIDERYSVLRDRLAEDQQLGVAGSAEQLASVEDAYAVLSDPDRRAAYDEVRATAAVATVPVAPAEVRETRPATTPSVFSGSYLGGHPSRERQEKQASLRFDDDGVHVSVFRAFIEEPWANIISLDAEGSSEVQKRFTATRFMLLGPLALAFKKDTKSACFVVVEGAFGEFIFQVKKKSVQELRMVLAPWRKRVGRGPELLTESVVVAPPAPTASDRLRELADLRDRGVVTEEEFSAKKSELLQLL